MGNGKVFAPNRYRVTLGSSDYERLAPWEAQLTNSLAELVQEHLDQNGWTTVGDIEVYLHRDDTLHTGVFGVASRMESEAPPRQRPYDSLSLPAVEGAGGHYQQPYDASGPGQPAPARAPGPAEGYGHNPIPSGVAGAGVMGAAMGAASPAEAGYGGDERGPGGGEPGAPAGSGYPGSVDAESGYGYDPSASAAPGAPAGGYPAVDAFGGGESGQPPFGGGQYDQYANPGYANPGYGNPGYGNQPGYPDQPSGAGHGGYPEQPYPGAGQGGHPHQPYGAADPYGGGAGHAAPPPPPPQPRVLAWLVVDGTDQHLQLRQGSNLVGRGHDCDMQLLDQGVSRRHVDVQFDGQYAVAYDLGSTNGTSVNGHFVGSHQLQHGDVLRVGHSRLVYQQEVR
jgi:hypothetical protein